MLAITQARAVTTPEVQDVLATAQKRRRTRLGAHGRSVCRAPAHRGLQLEVADFGASVASKSARKPPYVAPRCARGRENVVCIDHGVFLRQFMGSSVVRPRAPAAARALSSIRGAAWQLHFPQDGISGVCRSTCPRCRLYGQVPASDRLTTTRVRCSRPH